MTTDPQTVEQAYAMAQVCLDLHAALGVEWGGNPYLEIQRLKEARAALQRIAINYEDGQTFSGTMCAEIAAEALGINQSGGE